ncbi:C-type lectin mannose-binding isoform-like [Haliotis rubra]|uniref:C-type lectin mannose-binding isoform-like n=1 Tax=Haliotis rubra TaxID=36100 RepID=UPI001EE5BDCD|nr:C-type lectin mannose-binding isoform-like [Haliotis rubra]
MALLRLQLHLSLVHFLPSDIAPPTNVDNVLDCFSSCLRYQQCVSLIYNRNNKQCYTYPGRLEVPFWGTDINTDLDIYNTNRDGYGCPSHLGYDFNSPMNVCFKIHGDVKYGHYHADRICLSEGAHLIRINSSAKDELVSVMWPKGYVHIDGMCTVGKGWMYSNGDNVTYFRWKDDQPNGNCGTWGMCLHSASSGFNDIKCSLPYPFICEIDI